MNSPKHTTRAAERLTTSSATRKRRRVTKSRKDSSRTNINNLPENFQLTNEILKTNVCRLCATYHESGPKLLSLFETYKGCPLSNRINHLLPVMFFKNDGLPEVACRKCADQIVAWYEMHKNISIITHILESEAGLLSVGDQVQLNERLLLSETIETILASYSLYLESEIVCQLCDARTTSEEFVRHLETRHATVRDREALEMFIREHVTFEEALASDPEPDTSATAQSPAAVDTRSTLSHLEPHAEGNLEGVTRGDKSEGTEHSNDDHRSLEPIAGAGAAPQETNQKRIPAVCPHCNRTCSNKYNMLVHMNTHGGGQSARFDCECGKSYTTRGNLVAHRRAAHEGVLPHACGACGRGFPTRGARDEHARRHSGARPFVCGACGLAFRAPGALRQHGRTHAPRALACALCGKRFSRHAHLRYHVGTHRQAST